MKSNELKLSKKQPYNIEVLEQQIRNEVSADAPQGYKLAELVLEQEDFQRKINKTGYPTTKERSPRRQTITLESKNIGQNTTTNTNVMVSPNVS